MHFAPTAIGLDRMQVPAAVQHVRVSACAKALETVLLEPINASVVKESTNNNIAMNNVLFTLISIVAS